MSRLDPAGVLGTCCAMALILQYSASAAGEWDGAATFTSQASPEKLSELLWKHASRFWRTDGGEAEKIN